LSWFSWENRQETIGFLTKYHGFPVISFQAIPGEFQLAAFSGSM
jgi:hypothetical protein